MIIDDLFSKLCTTHFTFNEKISNSQNSHNNNYYHIHNYRFSNACATHIEWMPTCRSGVHAQILWVHRNLYYRSTSMGCTIEVIKNTGCTALPTKDINRPSINIFAAHSHQILC